ncbi:MAG: hypothetical protein RL325_894 [Planctomycetota bacterium]|jgi:hypothetical protein
MRMRNHHPETPRPFALVALAFGLATAGCSPRIAVPRTTEEGLREQLSTTTRERDDAQRRVRDLEAKLAERPRPAVGGMSAEAESVLPRLEDIRVDPMSSVRLDASGGPTLRLVIEPIDGKGRFLQITGDLEIGVMLTVSPTQMASVGDLKCGPKALSDAYRMGFLGTHYSFEIPLKIDPKQAPRLVTVNGSFTDALTGKPKTFQGSAVVRQFAATPAQ